MCARVHVSVCGFLNLKGIFFDKRVQKKVKLHMAVVLIVHGPFIPSLSVTLTIFQGQNGSD